MAAQVKMLLVIMAVLFDQDETRTMFLKVKTLQDGEFHSFHINGQKINPPDVCLRQDRIQRAEPYPDFFPGQRIANDGFQRRMTIRDAQQQIHFFGLTVISHRHLKNAAARTRLAKQFAQIGIGLD